MKHLIHKAKNPSKHDLKFWIVFIISNMTINCFVSWRKYWIHFKNNGICFEHKNYINYYSSLGRFFLVDYVTCVWVVLGNFKSWDWCRMIYLFGMNFMLAWILCFLMFGASTFFVWSIYFFQYIISFLTQKNWIIIKIRIHKKSS